MPAYFTLFIAAAGLAAATNPQAMNLGGIPAPDPTLAGAGSSAFSVKYVSGSCGIGMTTCDTGCMSLTGNCCGLGNGAYCSLGNNCVTNGCCPIGEVCTGPAMGCEDDRELCGDFCVSPGTCDSSGSGDGSGDGSESSDGSGGSGDSSGCPTGYEACGDGYMPTGSVCCNNGYHCLAGQTCSSDFTCILGDSGGSDGNSGSDGSDGSDSQATTAVDAPATTGDLFSPTSSLSPESAPSPTNPFSGGDSSSTLGSQPTTSSSKVGGSSASPKPTENAGVVNAPNVLAGFLALVPMVL